MLASEIYGITIHIHTVHSERVYQTDDECPIVHLVRLQSLDGCCVYLPTTRESVLQNNQQIDFSTDHTDGKETLNLVDIGTKHEFIFHAFLLVSNSTV